MTRLKATSRSWPSRPLAERPAIAKPKGVVVEVTPPDVAFSNDGGPSALFPGRAEPYSPDTVYNCQLSIMSMSRARRQA